MSVFESIERYPVEYLPTGDKALLMAWAVLTDPDLSGHAVMSAVLCLEDGRAVIAEITQFKFDYRYDLPNDRWIDVSKFVAPEEGSNADADQEDADDGSPEVPGRVPETG